MKEENNIDKLFRDRLYDQRIDYDPKAWSEAKKMIIDQEKKRFFLYRYRYYLSTLVIGIASYLVIFSNNGTVKSKESIGQNKSEMLIAQVSQNDAKEESSIDFAENSKSKILNKKSKTETKNFTAPKESKEVRLPEEKVNLSSINSKNSKESVPAPSNKQVSLMSNTKRPTSNMDQKKAFFMANKEISANQTPKPTPGLEYMIPKTLESNYELGEVKDVRHDPNESFDHPKKLSGLKILGGIGLTDTYDKEEQNGSYDPSFFFGIGFESRISHKFSLEVDLLVSQRNALNLTDSYSETLYGFGYETSETLYEYSTLRYVEIPVLINYNLTAFHQFSIGLQYASLLGTEVTITDYEESSLSPPKSRSEEKWIQSDLFNSSDFSLQFAYIFSITQKMGIGLRYQLGLSEMTNEALPQGKNTNDQLRFVIQYKPWK